MTPEEFRRGALIDTRTSVFVLGRAARLLLDAGDEVSAWRGSPARPEVLVRATHTDPEQRFATVRRFAAAWRATSRPGT
ncbi:hypothetical protein ACFWNT_34220 [Streptomyces sp. NPDC058409]|uniref:hypothetical protein n=1 Tax=Streptomyces sp. NPDC058409 TaxID=3346484 RepID=UPI003669DAB3